MKFVVATHSYLLLVEVGTDFQFTGVHLLDTGYFDGTDVMPDGTIIACYKVQPWSKASPTGFRFYDENGLLSIPPIDGSDILDPHQLTYDHDRRGIWNLSCATNEVVFKSLRDSARDWRWQSDTPGGDWNHLNSVCLDGQNTYIVFHNLAREPSDVREFFICPNDPGELFFRYRQVLPHYSIHNFEWLGDGESFAYNASDNGAIVRGVWGKDDYTECDIGEEWHPKGLCVTPRYAVSGYSEHAVSTPRRFISESGLVFVDMEGWQEAGRVHVTLDGKNVGNINEVRYYGR